MKAAIFCDEENVGMDSLRTLWSGENRCGKILQYILDQLQPHQVAEIVAQATYSKWHGESPRWLKLARLFEHHYEKNGFTAWWTEEEVDGVMIRDIEDFALEPDNEVRIVVLMTGDGDFTELVEKLQADGKKVWIVSWRGCLSGDLRLAADKLIVIDDILD